MKINDYVSTPRFCTVRISAIFNDKQTAFDCGFTEPTYYKGSSEIYGKVTGEICRYY